MRRHTIVEDIDCWIIDGIKEVKKYPKPQRFKTWMQDFLYDLNMENLMNKTNREVYEYCENLMKKLFN